MALKMVDITWRKRLKQHLLFKLNHTLSGRGSTHGVASAIFFLMKSKRPSLYILVNDDLFDFRNK